MKTVSSRSKPSRTSQVIPMATEKREAATAMRYSSSAVEPIRPDSSPHKAASTPIARMLVAKNMIRYAAALCESCFMDIAGMTARMPPAPATP